MCLLSSMWKFWRGGFGHLSRILAHQTLPNPGNIFLAGEQGSAPQSPRAYFHPGNRRQERGIPSCLAVLTAVAAFVWPFTTLPLQMLMAWGIKLANFTNSCPETCSSGLDHRSSYLVSHLPWQGRALKGSCKSRANVERHFTGKAVHPPTICDSRTS